MITLVSADGTAGEITRRDVEVIAAGDNVAAFLTKFVDFNTIFHVQVVGGANYSLSTAGDDTEFVKQTLTAARKVHNMRVMR